MTNGNWIRSMTDEQIGKTINLIVKQVVAKVHRAPYIEDEFINATIDWLKAERNEEGMLFNLINQDGVKERESNDS